VKRAKRLAESVEQDDEAFLLAVKRVEILAVAAGTGVYEYLLLARKGLTHDDIVQTKAHGIDPDLTAEVRGGSP